MLISCKNKGHCAFAEMAASRRVQMICIELCLINYRYWRFNEQARAADQDYPKPISVWGTSVPSSPKGAFLSDDGGE